MQNSAPKRIPELDAVRGLAAFSVVVFHYFLLLKASPQSSLDGAYHLTHILALTPLGLFWAGHQAVVLFFILSGFVLTLMLEGGHLRYGQYLLRRLTRLYLPYMAAVGIGVMLEFAVDPTHMATLGHWINKFWSWPITGKSLAQHATVVGEFNSDRYDFTIWSLVHEIRISLVFPLLLLLVSRTRWWVSLTALLSLSAAMILLRYGAFHGWGSCFSFADKDGLTNYTLTFHYLLAFGVGASLAHNRGAIKSWYHSLSTGKRGLLVLLSLLLYIDGGRFARWLGPSMMVIGDWPIMVGAAGLLIVSAFSVRASRVLLIRPFRWLGRISYSLYLFHPLVLLATLHLLYGRVPLPVSLAIGFVVTFPLSDLAWRLFERPAVRLSRRFSAPTSKPRRSHGSRRIDYASHLGSSGP